MPDDVSFPLPEQSQTVGAVMGADDGYTLHPDVDNLHLAFYRLAPMGVGDEDGTKRQYLEALIEQWKRLRENQWAQSDSPLKAVRQRVEAQLESLAAAGRSTRQLELETEGRLVAGLGYDSPTEVGLTLHPLYGFPYLPGSTVKGVARAYAERVEGVAEDDLLAVFGSTSLDERTADRRRGWVTFMDAVPAAVPRLELDVMTPHYGDYYAGDDPPGDWHEPSPVPFLAVAAGTPFQFPLVADSEERLEQAATWLKQGLFWLGAGGKTSSGYGLFTTETRRREAAEKRRQRRIEAELPPKMESIGKNTTGILARVLGPTRYDEYGVQEAKLDVVLHVEDYENMRVPMTGSEINVERFDADWVKVRVDRFFGKEDNIPLVRYESKWRP